MIVLGLKGEDAMGFEGAFTLGVRDSSVESLNTILVIRDLNLLIVKVLC
jgi:hypothetical protein